MRRADCNAVLAAWLESSVSYYRNVAFPLLCDLLLDKPSVERRRRELLAHAGGAILEIGFGTGLNLPCYPRGIHKITTVDPNPGMHARARKRIQHTGIAVDQRVLSSERLPFENASFDCVVSTFTLCSIPAVEQAVAEVHRVLKPGGRFLLLEHGLSPDPRIGKWQRRLNWLEMRLGDGCRLDRNIPEIVAAQPFAAIELEQFYIEKTPRTHGYLTRGILAK